MEVRVSERVKNSSVLNPHQGSHRDYAINSACEQNAEVKKSFTHKAIPDTGASVSVCAMDLINCWGFGVCQGHTIRELYACTGDAIKCAGVAHVEVQVGCAQINMDMIIVEQLRGEILICCEDLIRLGILRDDFPSQLTCNYIPKSVSHCRQNFTVMDSCLQRTLEKIFCEFGHVFETPGEGKIRPMAGPPMRIHLKTDVDVKPTRVLNARRVPIHLEEKASKEVASLIRQDILTKIDYPTTWCSPAMFIEKPDGGGLRLVTDFRGLNKCVERPVHPFPTATDIISLIPAGTQFFVKFDALKGYFQIPLEKSSIDLTTCMVPGHGRYAYKRAPMGLCSSGDEYCARGDAAFAGIQGVKKIVDDILIFAPDLETLVSRTTEVLKRCSVNSITLSKKKVQYGVEVKFAGYLVSQTGVRPDPDKVKAIRDFPPPRNLTELRSFLGLANQLGAFIPDLAHASKDIRGLLKKNIAWLWMQEHQDSFEKTKKVLLEKAVLHHYDVNKPVELMTDASRLNGLGFALIQRSQDDKPMIIQCGSRSLTDTETRYATIELELLAIVWAVQKCRVFLASRHFTLTTDHKPLIGIFKKTIDSIDNNRIQRLLDKLGGYTFTPQWMPGKQLCIADALSRAPVFHPADKDIHVVLTRSQDNPQLKSIIKCAEEDERYQIMNKFFMNPTPLKSLSPDHPVIPLLPIWHEVCLDDTGLLLYGDRIIVPERYRQHILDVLHVPHAGISRTREQARRFYYWPNLNKDIQNLVSRCDKCQESRPSKPTTMPRVKTLASRPMEKVSSDLFQIGNKHYVVIVDRFSGFTWVEKLTKLDSAAIIRALEKVFLDFGYPESIRTDGGPQFRTLFTKFCEDNGIAQETSSPYHPESNGHAEAAVKSMKGLLKKCNNWDQFKLALREWRNTPRTGSSISPAELMFQFRQNTKLPTLKKHSSKEQICEENSSCFSGHSQSSESFDKCQEKLPIGTHVLVQDTISKKWDGKGVIKDIRHTGRSYYVELDNNGGTLLRNIKFLKRKK